MVDVLGHLGMALIWLAPAWYFIERRKTAAVFVGLGFWFGMLPDVDLYLSNWFAGIHHHGVFHTILVVTLLAVPLGAILGWVFTKVNNQTELFSDRATVHAYTMGVIAVWVAGLSHLFADMLSAPDVATRIEPFWPLYNGSVVLIDVLWYTSVWATWGLLALGVAVNVVAWFWKSDGSDTRETVAASE
ncbi:metal-dependent hydrolase [Halorussus sp. MSC15.2]|uniref:metal-dependent hydrolase n=1 Tax=Halorussus sp. MSC15.2 TaxID=2283638 RepID=UPI0013D09EFD|nr:metal-dependent hydrolase [Halorussus sp. MSC15.2]NEU57242.1 metal-dependent hydrolase [Halorussus sp. MSC15.2]